MASRITEYGYDGAQRLASITYPGGDRAIYDRDSLGRVTGIRAAINGLTKAVLGNLAYYHSCPAGSRNYPNGLTVAKWRDKSYRQVGTCSHNVQDLRFGYDRQDRTRTIRNARASALGQGYRYDADSRRTAVTGGGAVTIQYIGSGLRGSLSNGVTDTYVNDPAGSRLSAISGKRNGSFSYGAPGNTSHWRYNGLVRILTYDGFNRALTVSGTTSRYNGLNQRVTRRDSARATHFVYRQAGNCRAKRPRLRPR